MRGRDPDRALRYTSCGFMDGGRSSPDTAQAVAREFGFELADHVSRSVQEIPTGSHLWVVMEAVHARGLVRAGISRDAIVFLGDFEPGSIPRRAILDPYGKSAEVFRETYTRIVRCLEVLRETDAG
jgi:protein-tyrosine-phosphatase